MSEDLVIWTIYDHPADYPQGFVVRPWRVGKGGTVPQGEDGAGVATLEAARSLIPQGLLRMDRDPNDDPCIVESWL